MNNRRVQDTFIVKTEIQSTRNAKVCFLDPTELQADMGFKRNTRDYILGSYMHIYMCGGLPPHNDNCPYEG
jgi:hypothetical protein